MEIIARCTNCGTRYRVDEGFLGRVVACKQCGVRFPLTAEAEASGDATRLAADDPARLLGQLAVRFHLLSQQQLDDAIATRPKGDEGPLGRHLVGLGLLTDNQLEFLVSVQRLKAERQAERRFGALAVENAFVTPEQVDAAMREQEQLVLKERRAVRIGDLLVERGILTAERRDALLAAQQRLSTTDAGPHGGVLVTIAADSLTAFVAPTEGALPDRATVETALRVRGVVFGIDAAAIDTFCGGSAPTDTPWAVARGRPAQHGGDAVVEYLFELNPLRAGRESEGGVIDFKDRGDVPEVAEGTLLARKQTATEGVPGSDVFGRTLKPHPPHDVPLRVGTGAALTEDRLGIVATAAGRPALSATGVVSVFADYRIDGDVGYKTGHINFHGCVTVSGTVLSGFHVRCGQLIAAEIEEAEVEADGDVIVTGGVIGGRIKAGGSVRARYLHRAELQVLGDVAIEREAVESQVECSGALIGERCTVLASRLSAKAGITVKAVGSESSPPSRLTAGIDERVERELEALAAAEAQALEAIGAAEEALAALQAQQPALEQAIGEAAQAQDRAMVRRRGLAPSDGDAVRQLDVQAAAAEEALNTLFAQQDALATEVAAHHAQQDEARAQLERSREEAVRLREWSEANPGDPLIEVSAVLFQDTRLRLPHNEWRVASTQHKVAYEERALTDADGNVTWQVVPRAPGRRH